jgi:hypothetical protein
MHGLDEAEPIEQNVSGNETQMGQDFAAQLACRHEIRRDNISHPDILALKAKSRICIFMYVIPLRFGLIFKKCPIFSVSIDALALRKSQAWRGFFQT